MKFSPLLFLFLFLIACTDKKNTESDSLVLGEINMEVTGKSDAQNAFKEGMLLLHSFEYTDAEEKFKQAQSIDPDFAMAYWGQAMCKNHPLWREQEYNSAKEILSKLGETKEDQRSKFVTEFEKDMFDAISILYGDGSKRQRDQAYSDYLEILTKKYPDNHEIRSFYALSILGAVKDGRDYEAYANGARVAKSILDENPNHPGALHYLIHSYDDPDNAHKALDAANEYSKVAPDAGHALHMPSHIYVALGMWDDVISSNIRSWEAGQMRKEEKGLDNDALNYHAFKWLMYAYLQKGNFTKARELVVDMQKYCYELPSKRAVSHLVDMKAAYFIESKQWNDSLVMDTINYSKHSFNTRNSHYYFTGMYAFEQKNKELLYKQIAQMDELYKMHTEKAITNDAPMCSGSYNRYDVTKLDLDRSMVMQLEMKAMAEMLSGNTKQTEVLLKEAVALEQQTSYSFGPPEIFKPSSELYAEWLTSQGRIDESKEQLKLVLERAPGRLIAMNAMSKLDAQS